MSGGLSLPPAGADETAAFAAELIDRSGKARELEAALAHATGRPRALPVRAVLTALACLALDDRPLFLTDGTRRCPQKDSNLRTRLRRPVLYPLSYGGSVVTLKGYQSGRIAWTSICALRIRSPNAVPSPA